MSFQKTIAIFVAALFVLVFAGCSSSTNPVGETSSSAFKSNSGSSSVVVGEADFVGSWEIVQSTVLDDGSDGGGISQEDIEYLRERGVDYYVVLNPDGSAVLVLGGVHHYGTWAISDDAPDLGYGPTVLIDYASPGGGSYKLIGNIVDESLMLFDSHNGVDCVKVEGKEPLPKDEFNATLEAFVGTWHLSSATRDGVTITKEAGQIDSDSMLDFKNTMEVTLSYDGDSTDAPWFITGANTGCVYAPIGGYLLTISDGVLTVDFGDQGTMSFVKE